MYTCIIYFFFNDTATTEIYTLSLHDALPIYVRQPELLGGLPGLGVEVVGDLQVVADEADGDDDDARHPGGVQGRQVIVEDRKSTRLNSSHANISYAVFCLKKKTKTLSVYINT